MEVKSSDLCTLGAEGKQAAEAPPPYEKPCSVPRTAPLKFEVLKEDTLACIFITLSRERTLPGSKAMGAPADLDTHSR